MKTTTLRDLWKLFGVGILMVCMPAVSRAAIINWTNNGGSGDYNWNTASNWSSSSVPGVGDSPLFDNNSSASNPVIYNSGTATPTLFEIYIGNSINKTGALSISGAGSSVVGSGNAYVGRTGSGTLFVGAGATFSGGVISVGTNVGGSGTIILAGGTAGIGGTGTVTIRGNSGATGTVRGYGTLSGRMSFSNQIINNGKVIADGGGTDQVLTLTNGAGKSAVTSNIENTTDNGYYAINHGKVSFSSDTTSGAGSYSWGEASGDATIDMVNSARVTFGSATNAVITGSLLALDRTDIHAANGAAAGEQFVGYWNFTLTSGTLADFSLLQFRYDDALIASLGADEADLALFYYDAGSSAWTLVDGSADTTNHIYTSNTGTRSFGDYALGVVPEPTTWALLFCGVFLLVIGRRRVDGRL